MGKKPKKTSWEMTPAQQKAYDAKKLLIKGRTGNDVAAFRDALAVFRELAESNVADWTHHHHMGIALREIGERTVDIASLEAAIQSYRQALELMRPDPDFAAGSLAHSTLAEPSLGIDIAARRDRERAEHLRADLAKARAVLAGLT